MKVLLSLLLLLAAPIVGAAPLIRDGGFEAGLVPTFWTQSSTNFGTPVCDASCGGVGPRTGTFWAWFGGANAAEASSVQQVGEIAVGQTNLSFYVWWSSSVASPPDPTASFTVKMDGNTIFTLTPATAAAYNVTFTRATVDISAFANGASHTLRFDSTNVASAAATNIHLDDVNISAPAVDPIFANGFE